MGRALIKPERDEDFYVEWSSIVDMPVRWGSRQNFLDATDSEEAWQAMLKRLAQVDERSRTHGMEMYSWDRDFELIVQQEGYLKRSQMAEFMKTLTEDGELTEASKALLEPIDWEDD